MPPVFGKENRLRPVLLACGAPPSEVLFLVMLELNLNKKRSSRNNRRR